MTPPRSPDHARLRALADAATPGPWLVRTSKDGRDPKVYVTGRMVAEGATDTGRFYVAYMPPSGTLMPSPEADAAFIAECRDAVPALLTERDRLREALREAIEHVTVYDDAVGHSYCATQGEDPADCTCGFDDMVERWRGAAIPAGESE